MYNKLSFTCLITLTLLAGCSADKSPADYVDVFIGTGGHGHTYPGPAMPFGMIQPGPDTRLTGWDGCSGYHYSDSVIYGFSHTHLSGTGISDYGDILIMPETGTLRLTNNLPWQGKRGYPSRFSHQYEWASPGYYAVILQDDSIKAELTTADRTAMHRYTPLKPVDTLHLILDLIHRDKVLASSIRITGKNEIAGYRRSTGWAKDQRVWFVMRFSGPIVRYGFESNGKMVENTGQIDGDSLKAWFTFDASTENPLLVKVGISAVDIEGARNNLETEIPGWDFEKVRENAGDTWKQQLGKIEITGSQKADKVKFYTALYHACLNPNLYTDVDGRYLGHDMQVHHMDKGSYYTLFSLWDTYRAEHPLLNLIEPERTRDFIRTFLIQYQQGGSLPVWELSANETWTMIGYHAVPVIVDAWRKGLREFDASLALKAMISAADADREGLPYYRKKGFIGVGDESESVSRTLEYAYDDWCIAQMANMLNRDSVYRTFIRRAQYYKNVFDPETGFMRGRVNGGWFTPFDPREVNFNYTEANAWQYTFSVPQDVNGLIGLMGGDQAFATKLDRLFSEESETTGRQQADITGMIGQYAHGNEPSHHIAYLYDYVGQAWKTQAMIRKILEEQYHAAPDGLSGNEDAGQMSAWFVLSSLGFYSVTPGSDMYVIGSPLFKKAVIHLGNGKTFTIRAQGNNPAHPYIGSARLNGKNINRTWFTHTALEKGGVLELSMTGKPVKTFGASENNRPVSSITDDLIVPVPFVTNNARTFIDSLVVGVEDADTGTIYLSTNHDPDHNLVKYDKPLVLRKSTTLTASMKKNGTYSKAITASYMKIPGGRRVTLYSTYSPQYSAGGDQALVDFIRGPANFRTGSWQGYEGEDLVAVVDLGKMEEIHYLGAGFLQDVRSWIFFPEKVEFSISNDGKTFVPIGEVRNTVSSRDEKVMVREFGINVYPKKTRFIRVRAKNIGTVPAWHIGAGGKAWLFSDEIVVR